MAFPFLSDRQITADYKKTLPASNDDLELADKIEKDMRFVILELNNIKDQLKDIGDHINANQSYNRVVYSANTEMPTSTKESFVGFAKILREKIAPIFQAIDNIKKNLMEYGEVEDITKRVETISQHAQALKDQYFDELLHLIGRVHEEKDFLKLFGSLIQALQKDIFIFTEKILKMSLVDFLDSEIRGEV
ncbi:MAG: hypothetical protein ACTSU6_08210 [Candidatus Njordarchaeales archaeon]